MPPARGRVAVDELKSEPTITKDRNGHHATGSGKSKKNGASAGTTVPSTRDATLNSTTSATASNGSIVQPGIDWSTEDPQLLHKYRNLYNLDTPAAFQTPLTAALLTMPGIGRHSPTMAARKKAKRNVQKEQLAMSVRKHFNGHAITETDVVVNFLYTVKTQDRSFKIKFGVSKK